MSACDIIHIKIWETNDAMVTHLVILVMSQPIQNPEICGEPLLDPGPEHFILFPLKDSVVMLLLPITAK